MTVEVTVSEVTGGGGGRRGGGGGGGLGEAAGLEIGTGTGCR